MLARIVTIPVSVVVLLTSIELILEKCVNLQVQYSPVIARILVSFEAILIHFKACGRSLLAF